MTEMCIRDSDPRWGRGMEAYGEDPYLVGRMAVEDVYKRQVTRGTGLFPLLRSES